MTGSPRDGDLRRPTAASRHLGTVVGVGRWLTLRTAGLVVTLVCLGFLVRWCVAGVEVQVLGYELDRAGPAQLTLYLNECGDGPYRIDVDERADQVSVSVTRQRGLGDGGDGCSVAVQADLDAPLNGRTVIDRSTGRVVPQDWAAP